MQSFQQDKAKKNLLSIHVQLWRKSDIVDDTFSWLHCLQPKTIYPMNGLAYKLCVIWELRYARRSKDFLEWHYAFGVALSISRAWKYKDKENSPTCVDIPLFSAGNIISMAYSDSQAWTAVCKTRKGLRLKLLWQQLPPGVSNSRTSKD